MCIGICMQFWIISLSLLYANKINFCKGRIKYRLASVFEVKFSNICVCNTL